MFGALISGLVTGGASYFINKGAVDYANKQQNKNISMYKDRIKDYRGMASRNLMDTVGDSNMFRMQASLDPANAQNYYGAYGGRLQAGLSRGDSYNQGIDSSMAGIAAARGAKQDSSAAGWGAALAGFSTGMNAFGNFKEMSANAGITEQYSDAWEGMTPEQRNYILFGDMPQGQSYSSNTSNGYGQSYGPSRSPYDWRR